MEQNQNVALCKLAVIVTLVQACITLSHTVLSCFWKKNPILNKQNKNYSGKKTFLLENLKACKELKESWLILLLKQLFMHKTHCISTPHGKSFKS